MDTYKEILGITDRLEKSFRMEVLDGLELWRLGRDRFDEFNRFVWGVYKEAFIEEGTIPFSLEEIIESSESYFDIAKVCAVIHPDGTILGTWGLILKDVKDNSILPIQKEFGLSTYEILLKMKSPNVKYLFNGWRNAVNKDALVERGFPANHSIFVFDLLLRGLIADFSEPKQYLGVAEMEMLVYKYHRRVGIPWELLGESHHFWGRDRFPCAFRVEEMIATLQNNKPARFDFIFGSFPKV